MEKGAHEYRSTAPYKADYFLPTTCFSLRALGPHERPKLYQRTCLTAAQNHLAFQMQNMNAFKSFISVHNFSEKFHNIYI